MLRVDGINIDVFKAYSVRSFLTSKAKSLRFATKQYFEER